MNKLQEYFSVEHLHEVYRDRVRMKSGRGIDRISASDFDKNIQEHLRIINRKCLNQTYIFSPYVQKLILKGKNKLPRVISIPTIRDKIVLNIILEILQDIFNNAVNRELPNAKVRRLAEFLNSTNQCQEINLHRVDIANFYGSINRDTLVDKIAASDFPEEVLSLIKKSISNITVPTGYNKEDKKKFIEKHGIPQGLPCSNILAEIYLSDFDEKIKSNSVHYERYVDDMVVLTDLNFNFEIYCTKLLKTLNLTTNESKTEFECTGNKFTFLGYDFKNNTITARKKSYEKLLNSISMMFVRLRKSIFIDTKKDKKKQIGIKRIKKAFIEDLNVKLTGARSKNKTYGWVHYFSEMNSLEYLYQIDRFVTMQFKKSIIFENVPKDLKKISRAYFEIKFNSSETSYIHNYSEANVQDRRRWLRNRGLVEGYFNKDEIDRLYEHHVGRLLSQLEQDLGHRS